MDMNFKTDAEARAYLDQHVTNLENELEHKMANDKLAALAGAHIELEPEDYKDDRQPEKFAVHCVVAIAVMIECASLLGALWCVSLNPACAFLTALCILTSLFGLWLFTAVEDQL